MGVSLSCRLQTAARLVDKAQCLADIGCDHGKLCVHCLLSGAVQSAIAVDISADSLDKARRLGEQYNVPLSCRLGDGMSVVAANEADCVVIAGMGGMQTAHILAHAPYAAPRLVLVPHKNTDAVHRYLLAAGYRITYDGWVQDGRFWYRSMAASATEQAVCLGDDWQQAIDALPEDANWYFGRDALADPRFDLYRAQRIQRLQRIVQAGNTQPAVRYELHYLLESQLV